MKFGAKKTPTVLAGVTFRAKFHSKSLYSVEKRLWESRSTPTLAIGDNNTSWHNYFVSTPLEVLDGYFGTEKY
jgi:hypothetical protein